MGNAGWKLAVVSIFVFVLLPLASARLSEEELAKVEELNNIFAKVAQEVKPSVVNIRTEKVVKIPTAPFEYFDDIFRRFFNEPFEWSPPEEEGVQRSLGSGVIVSEDGYIVTNYHVIKNHPDEIWVTLADERRFKAEVVGSDPETDLAVLKIDAKGLPAIKMGDSDQVREGEWVLAIGNPFGLGHTITAGIVSAKGKSLGLAEIENYIQTDAPINPGNSGGALVNLKGELIGINTAIVSTSRGYEGIGFAIPVNIVKQVIKSIIEKGEVVRGYLGVLIGKVDSDLARKLGLKKPMGAVVSKVYKDSPADKAGIKRGDVILKYGGKEVEGPSDLQEMVVTTEPGKKVKLEIWRGGKRRTVEVKIGKRPAKVAEAGARVEKEEWVGITVQELTPDLARRFGYKEDLKGVIITHVRPGSPAYSKGLRRGDVIREINGKEIESIEDYREALKEAKPEEGLLLWVHRKLPGGEEMDFYVAIYPEK